MRSKDKNNNNRSRIASVDENEEIELFYSEFDVQNYSTIKSPLKKTSLRQGARRRHSQTPLSVHQTHGTSNITAAEDTGSHSGASLHDHRQDNSPFSTYFQTLQQTLACGTRPRPHPRHADEIDDADMVDLLRLSPSAATLLAHKADLDEKFQGNYQTGTRSHARSRSGSRSPSRPRYQPRFRSRSPSPSRYQLRSPSDSDESGYSTACGLSFWEYGMALSVGSSSLDSAWDNNLSRSSSINTCLSDEDNPIVMRAVQNRKEEEGEEDENEEEEGRGR